MTDKLSTEELITANADYPSQGVIAVHLWETYDLGKDDEVYDALKAADGVENALDKINYCTIDRAELARLKNENATLRTLLDDLRDRFAIRIGRRLQEMASSGDLNRYVIQDCADSLLGLPGAPGSEF